MNDNHSNYTENYMISFDHAIELINHNIGNLDSEQLAVAKASGRIVASDVRSKCMVPPFNNSAMDGFAIWLDDQSEADLQRIGKLPIVGVGAAGDKEDVAANLTTSSAWKIMTGAPVPKIYNTVVPVENCIVTEGFVEFTKPPVSGSNIRHAGEDFKLDQALLSRGMSIGANQIMALTAQGIGKIDVFKPIDVAVFSTGKELVDGYEQPLQFGQIRNSNRPFILEWLKHLPVSVSDRGTNHDDVGRFENDLKEELNKGTKIIISTGAVSMGDFDFIPRILKKLGAEIIFHKAKIRPGKPVLFARFDNGSCYFGLPGNPISTAIGLRFFVYNAFRKLWGLSIENATPTISRSSYKKKAELRVLLKANRSFNSKGQLTTTILDGQESFKISPLLDANGWAMISEGNSGIDQGELVDFYPTYPYREV